jgi:hypothetical protein
MALRAKDPAQLATLPTEHLLNIINNIAISGCHRHLLSFTEDFVEMSQHVRNPDVFNQLARALVTAVASASGMHPHIAWTLVQTLGDQRIELLEHDIIYTLAQSIALSAPPPDMDPRAALASLVTAAIQKLPLPSRDMHTSVEEYGRALHQIGHLLVILGNLGDQQGVYTTLTSLFEAERIPSAVLRAVDLSSPDARVLTMNIVCKTLIYWNQHHLATTLFSRHFTSLPLFGLGLDILAETIEVRSKHSLNSSTELLCNLFQVHTKGRVPDELLESFYTVAHEMRRTGAAQVVYKASQSILADPPYLPPSGGSLVFLMRHMTGQERDLAAARALARHVVSSGVRIQLQQRGAFIQMVARAGFALEARSLWQTYSVGDDAKFVTGHAPLAMALTRLFTRLAEKQAAKLQYMQDGSTNPTSTRPSKEDDGETPIEQQLSHTHTQTEDVASAPQTDGGEEDTVNDTRHLLTEVYLRDLEAFVDQVYTTFKETKEPLRHAEHFDLTTLARMAFIRGQTREGFAVLSILLDRKEVPDMYDVNVALSAMATHNPREAAALLRRMREHGLQPDAVTVSTVLTQAVEQDDFSLVRWLVSYARWLDRGEVSLHGIGALVLACFKSEGISPEAQQRNLRRGVNILKSVRNAPTVVTPALANVGIWTALRAEDALMAFDLWYQFLRRSTDHASLQGLKMRTRIRTLVKRHVRDGRLMEKEGRQMVRSMDLAWSLKEERKEKVPAAASLSWTGDEAG